MPFTFRPGPIPGLVIAEPRVFRDERGFFTESYKESEFAAAGIDHRFVQDNLSRSAKGVLRGLHFQREPRSQGKLVRVTRGRAWDVAVDLRPDSATYREWFGLELSEENGTILFIPRGFAHGFLSLEEGTELQYKCTAEYDASSDGGLRWNDEDLAIAWPSIDVFVSPKDAALPRLREVEASL
jgi:dTDP-4-dehydrorhamnose 3,5-epimerase